MYRILMLGYRSATRTFQAFFVTEYHLCTISCVKIEQVVHFTMYNYCTYNCTIYIVHLRCLVSSMSILSRRNAASNMSALVLMLPRSGNYGRRILKEPEKIHADSCTIYSCTHVSLAGLNFRRIYQRWA
jgi:hypothetical protein